MTGGRELGEQGRGGVEDGDMETAALNPAQSSKHSHKCGIMLKLIHSIEALIRGIFE